MAIAPRDNRSCSPLQQSAAMIPQSCRHAQPTGQRLFRGAAGILWRKRRQPGSRLSHVSPSVLPEFFLPLSSSRRARFPRCFYPLFPAGTGSRVFPCRSHPPLAPTFSFLCLSAFAPPPGAVSRLSPPVFVSSFPFSLFTFHFFFSLLPAGSPLPAGRRPFVPLRRSLPTPPADFFSGISGTSGRGQVGAVSRLSPPNFILHCAGAAPA